MPVHSIVMSVDSKVHTHGRNAVPCHRLGALLSWNHCEPVVYVSDFRTHALWHTFQTSNCDRIAAVDACPNGNLVAVAGALGVVELFRLQGSGRAVEAQHIHSFYGHRNEVLRVLLSSPFGLLVCFVVLSSTDHCSPKPRMVQLSAGADGVVNLWDVNRLRFVNSLPCHEGPVELMDMSESTGDIVTACNHPLQGVSK